MTTAREPMTRRVVVAPPDLPLQKALDLMNEKRFRHLPVVEDGLLLGMVSDRDLLLRATLGKDDWPEMLEGTVRDAMTAAPYVCAPNTPVEDLVRTMTEQKIDAVPVVAGANALVGLVTSTDLMLLLLTPNDAKEPIPFQFHLDTATAPIYA
jgi:acetoin utilization protein AcuB